MSEAEVPEKIMSRITAFLTRAAHPNTPEPEAKLCAEQAEKLMIKYSISSAKLDAEQEHKSDIGSWMIELYGAHQQHRKQLLIQVGAIFACKVLIHSRGRKYEYELIGRRSDLAMVFTLFEHLLAQLDAKIASFAGQPQAFKKSYCLSFASTVRARLEALYNEAVSEAGPGTALVLADVSEAVQEWTRKEYGVLGNADKLSNSSPEGRLFGYIDGKKADIFLPGARLDSNSDDDESDSERASLTLSV